MVFKTIIYLIAFSFLLSFIYAIVVVRTVKSTIDNTVGEISEVVTSGSEVIPDNIVPPSEDTVEDYVNLYNRRKNYR